MWEKGSKSAIAFETLQERITRLDYTPGQVLKEGDIAAEFGLSRTPVRGIFLQIKEKGLLNVIPRYGAQVMPIDLRYMKSVFEAVRELEIYAVRLAAQRLSEEDIAELSAILERLKEYDQDVDYRQLLDDDARFHNIIIQGSENICIAQQLADLHLHTRRFWHFYHQNLHDKQLYYATLRDLLSALRCRDPRQADHYAKEHIEAFVEVIREELL